MLVTDVVVPTDVKISNYAFSGYKYLEIVSFAPGYSVSSIGIYAFEDCSVLKKITIPESITSIESGAFSGCNSLQEVHLEGEYNTWFNISFGNGSANPLYNGALLYVGGEAVREWFIPEGVTAINNYAFYGNKTITEIIIPDSVTFWQVLSWFLPMHTHGGESKLTAPNLVDEKILSTIAWVSFA
jgi:hypothetical protein